MYDIYRTCPTDTRIGIDDNVVLLDESSLKKVTKKCFNMCTHFRPQYVIPILSIDCNVGREKTKV